MPPPDTIDPSTPTLEAISQRVRQLEEQSISVQRRSIELQRQVQTLQGSGSVEPLVPIVGWNETTPSTTPPTATWVGQGQLLLAGVGLTFEKPAQTPFLRLKVSGAYVCADYVVCSDGCGTHTTLFGAGGAFPTALADGKTTSVIHMCNSETAAASESLTGLNKAIIINGSGITGNGIFSGGGAGYGTRITLTGPTLATPLFNGAPSTDGSVTFRDLGIKLNNTQPLCDQTTSNGAFKLEFYRVGFQATDSYILTNISGVNGRSVPMIFEHCRGEIGYFTDYNNASGSGQANTVKVRNCVLTMKGLWRLTTDPVSAGNGPASLSFLDSDITLTASQSLNKNTTFFNRNVQFNFLTAGTLFTTTVAAAQIHVFDSVILYAGAVANVNFYSWTPVSGSAQLIFNDVAGYSSVAQAGTFIAFTNPPTLLSAKAVTAPQWATVFSGATAVGDDHGLLVGLADDDHTQYALLLGRAGGQTLIGGTAASNALLLQSTSHATKGSIQFEDANLSLALNATVPTLQFDTGADAFGYDRTANQFFWKVGGSDILQADGSDFRVKGYSRFGSLTAPVNVTAGDITGLRLMVGVDAALGQNSNIGQHAQFLFSNFAWADTASGQHFIVKGGKSSAAGINQFIRMMRITGDDASGSGTMSRFGGLDISITHSGAGALTNLHALSLTLGQYAAGGTVSNAEVIHVFAPNPIEAAITVLVGHKIDNLGSANVGTAIAFDIAAQSGASVANFGIRNASNLVQTQYARFGAVTAPTNVTDGDITGLRIHLGTDDTFALGNALRVITTQTDTSGNPIQNFMQLTIDPGSASTATFEVLRFQLLLEQTGDITGAIGINAIGGVVSTTTAGGITGQMRAFRAQGLFLGGQPASVQTFASIRAVDAQVLNRSGNPGNWTITEGIVYNVSETSKGSGGSITYTTQIGLNIPNLTGAVTNIGIKNGSSTVFTPTVTQSIAVTASIVANATVVQISTTTAANMTAVPTIADGTDGQILTIVNVGANTFTLQDQGTLAGSNLRLSAVGVALATRDSIMLMYSATIGDWIQIGTTNVI